MNIDAMGNLHHTLIFDLGKKKRKRPEKNIMKLVELQNLVATCVLYKSVVKYKLIMQNRSFDS